MPIPNTKTIITSVVISLAAVAIANRIPQVKAVISGDSGSWF